MNGVIAATQAQAEQLRAMRDAFDSESVGTSRAVVARYVFFHTLADELAKNGIDINSAAPAGLLAAHAQADQRAVTWCAIVNGLAKGQAEFVGLQQGGDVVLGTVLK